MRDGVTDNLQDYTLIPLEGIQTNMYRFVCCLPSDVIGLHFDIESSRNSSQAKSKASRDNGFVTRISTCRIETHSAYK